MDFTCFCHDPDHEQCYDGLVGIYDEECSCCRNTVEQLDLLGAPGRVVMRISAKALLLQTLETLIELSRHPAFEGDAPEFNEGGIGYEACRRLREYIKSQPST